MEGNHGKSAEWLLCGIRMAMRDFGAIRIPGSTGFHQ
jgi:hypothetical protein